MYGIVGITRCNLGRSSVLYHGNKQAMEVAASEEMGTTEQEKLKSLHGCLIHVEAKAMRTHNFEFQIWICLLYFVKCKIHSFSNNRVFTIIYSEFDSKYSLVSNTLLNLVSYDSFNSTQLIKSQFVDLTSVSKII